MRYTRIIVMALVALMLAGTADAQVSVRRQNRNKTEEGTLKPTAKPSRGVGKATDATPTAVKPAAKPATAKTSENTQAKPMNPVVKSGASTTKKKNSNDQKTPAMADGKSLRQQAFDTYQKESQEETPWQHVVYREIDLMVEKNASLYYPIDPQDGLTNLFRVILAAYAKGDLKGYEYLGDRESFEDRYLTKPQEVLDKFEIPYRVENNKGKEKEVYVVDEIDIPSVEVLSYYVKERWEFDQKHSRFVPRVLCICPVLHRTSEAGDGKAKYPMFWINFEDLRPLLRDHLVVSSGMNHAARYSMEEFFTLYQYEGTIYKEQNLRGLTLQQQYTNPDSLKVRQEEIEKELRGFGEKIWVEEEAPEENQKASKADNKKSQSEKKASGNEVKTGRRDRRTKEEVVVDSVAIQEKATKKKSVRR